MHTYVCILTYRHTHNTHTYMMFKIRKFFSLHKLERIKNRKKEVGAVGRHRLPCVPGCKEFMFLSQAAGS